MENEKIQNKKNIVATSKRELNGAYRAKLHILGSGSAMPNINHFPTSHIFQLRDKQYMIDCGEGAQIRLQEMKLSVSRLNHIFISHLHGDHFFGLIGLISSFGMLKRTADLHIHAHPDLERLLAPLLGYFNAELSYTVFFHPINPSKHSLIYEDRSIEVYTIPLKHRVPACGFLFKEKIGLPHIKREMIDFHKVPEYKIGRIKMGDDFINEADELIPNNVFVMPPTPPVQFAYCSDTSYLEKIIPIIEKVDLLYHEATFAETEVKRAKQTMHSTAKQAANIALKANVDNLIIGHFSARYDDKNLLLEEAKTIFENTLLAKDKTTYFIQ